MKLIANIDFCIAVSTINQNELPTPGNIFFTKSQKRDYFQWTTLTYSKRRSANAEMVHIHQTYRTILTSSHSQAQSSGKECS